MLKALHTKKWLSVVFCFFLLAAMVISLAPGTTLAADPILSGPYFSTTTDVNGNELGVAITPVKPPDIQPASVAVPDVHIAGVLNNLSNVPVFNWCYGCSATSASMLFGYYDRHGYGNMYTGPANGGVCPLNNIPVWGTGECPINATHQGIDGRATKGHVDDYWDEYGSNDPDPWIGNWTPHTPLDCAGDFMGTNQSTYGNSDGGTTYYYWTDGSPFGKHGVSNDYLLLGPTQRDGSQGTLMYAEYCGYSVIENYTQLIDTLGLTYGFTFAQYMAEIDAGRPVFIHVEGHTMVGVGYDADTNTVYLHNTWDSGTGDMEWGGSYSGMAHWGVTVTHLTPPGGYNQIWWLDSTKVGGNPVMENTGTQSGSVPVENGDNVIWKSNASASGDVVFDAGSWTVCLNTDNLTGDYAVQIGESEGALGFTPFNEEPETGSFHSPLTLYITLPSVTVPDGHYLALRVSNTGTGSVITNGTSYLGSPYSTPSYPIPELSSGILAGLGLTGLAVFIVIKRRKARVLAEN